MKELSEELIGFKNIAHPLGWAILLILYSKLLENLVYLYYLI